MKLPVYRCLIDENPNDESGIYAISFVDEPANETAFVALKKQPCQEHLSLDRKKQILTGVVLRPEQLIYRNSAQMGEYYIKFSAEQIEKISHKMMRTSLALHNTTHQHQQPLDGNYLIELWIVEDPNNDKSNALGFRDLPKGTLMCSYKVEDKAYWETQVLAGHVKGFSLEGFFFQELESIKIKNMKQKKFKFSALKRGALLLAGLTREELSEIESIEVDDTTDSGDPYFEFVLSDGKIVKVDDSGFATLDGEQVPAGEHSLSDGNILVIDEEGNFVETKEASSASPDAEQAVAPEALRKQKMEAEKKKQEAKTSNNNSLGAQIEAMQKSLQELRKVVDASLSETKSEIELLKGKTPSTKPATQKKTVDMSKASHTDRMAHSAMMTLQARKK